MLCHRRYSFCTTQLAPLSPQFRRGLQPYLVEIPAICLILQWQGSIGLDQERNATLQRSRVVATPNSSRRLQSNSYTHGCQLEAFSLVDSWYVPTCCTHTSDNHPLRLVLPSFSPRGAKRGFTLASSPTLCVSACPVPLL
jgi:hypothetical protein